MEQGTAFLEALMREFTDSKVQWQNDIAAYEERIADRLQRQHQNQDLELHAAQEQVSSELNEAKEAIAILESQNKVLTEGLAKAFGHIGQARYALSF